MREILSDTSELEAERARLMEELTAVGLLTQKLFEEKAEGKLAIYPDGTAEFLFKNGTTVTEKL